jgi:hypothetical protein
MTANSITNSNLMNKLLIGVIILLSIIIMWLIYKDITRPSSTKDDIGPIIVRQVKEVSELTTAVFETEAVIPVSKKGEVFTIPLPLESKLLYIAHGIARVGVDLSKFKKDDVEVNDHNITVTLPPLKVLDRKLDLKHSKVYSYDRGFLGLGPDVVNLQSDAQRKAEKKIEESAHEDWVIKIATERVEKTVDTLLSEILSDKGYSVTVKVSQVS